MHIQQNTTKYNECYVMFMALADMSHLWKFTERIFK